MKSKSALALTFLALNAFPLASAQGPDSRRSTSAKFLYKTTLVQAAPGRLLDLIDIYKQQAAQIEAATGDAPPLWMRHSQGDHWDLLLLYPVERYAEYYRPDRIAKREKFSQAWAERMNRDVAWSEDVFAYGPSLEMVKAAFATAGFFHVEMFVALAEKREQLIQQREMENAYSKSLKLTENLIFTRDQGAAWDAFTIGCYRNLKHYAESGDIPRQDAETAARAAGFESASAIGPYLRTLISSHHDTLAVAIP